MERPSESAAMADAINPPALSREGADRNAAIRTDAAQLAAVRVGEFSKLIAVREGRLFSTAASLDLLPVPQEGDLAYLGACEGTHYFSNIADELAPAETDSGNYRSLREVGALLSDLEAGLAVSAVALQNWHRTHTHCPRCGSETRVDQGGWVRTCPADGSTHFPRTDPAVIVSVIDGSGRLLLARALGWADHQYSVLAGFCEPGESLEQAIRREVFEESGVRVTSFKYLGSQPWPFPASLMLAFTASGSGEIQVDAQEIVDARWFSRSELKAACEQGSVLLPPPVSIAHRLIEAWWGEPLPESWLRR